MNAIFSPSRFQRMTIAIVVFAVMHTWLEPPISRTSANWVFRLGAAAGCDYFQSRNVLMTPDGPFFNGPGASAFNFAYRNIPWQMTYLVPFLAALTVYHLLTARAKPKTDGHTHCGRCGYILKGLREPRCPECGQTI